MKVPGEYARDVQQMVRDFARVTAGWIASGEYTAEEVAEWREIIRRDMQTEKGANSAIDPRPQGERIVAWCRTWRELAERVERGMV